MTRGHIKNTMTKKHAKTDGHILVKYNLSLPHEKAYFFFVYKKTFSVDDNRCLLLNVGCEGSTVWITTERIKNMMTTNTQKPDGQILMKFRCILPHEEAYCFLCIEESFQNSQKILKIKVAYF